MSSLLESYSKQHDYTVHSIGVAINWPHAFSKWVKTTENDKITEKNQNFENYPTKLQSATLL
jgi:hypothetical protein